MNRIKNIDKKLVIEFDTRRDALITQRILSAIVEHYEAELNKDSENE